MNYTFIDRPTYVSITDYEGAINRMVEKLQKYSGVRSVYQIGSISTPGISDIDLFVVFADAALCHSNPVNGLSSADKYLFTHNLFGTCRKYCDDIEQYTFFGKYKLLWGEEYAFNTHDLDKRDHELLKRQIGLEYLIKGFITLTIQKTYGIIKVRSLLLLVKALRIDLEWLDINSSKLRDLIDEMLLWRDNWFETQINSKKLTKWVNEFHDELHNVLGSLLLQEKFYLPENTNLSISKHIYMKSSDRFHWSHTGIVLPSLFAMFGKKYLNMQNRFNQFHFHLPTHHHMPHIISKRYDFISKIVKYNQRTLSHFVSTAYGLNIF